MAKTRSRAKSRSASSARRSGPGKSAKAKRSQRRSREEPRPPAGSAGGRVAEELTRAKRSSHSSGTLRKDVKRGRPVLVKKRTTKAKSPARAKPKTKPKIRKESTRSRSRATRATPRKLSPAAVERARRRRLDRRGIADQLQYEREERDRLRAERRRERDRGAPPDPTRLAISWLEEIRNVVAGVAFCSLDLTSPEPGARTPWLIVGRYTFVDPVDYLTLAAAVRLLRDDITLEATIGPQRLSQIRIVYRDPQSRRGEGDSIVSKTGAWEFVVSDLLGELVGAGLDDEDSLAVRYKETTVPVMYVYFAPDLVPYNVRVFRRAL